MYGLFQFIKLGQLVNPPINPLRESKRIKSLKYFRLFKTTSYIYIMQKVHGMMYIIDVVSLS